MNWDAMGAIGEIVGAVAVVFSLVYLSLQIRNQNNESRIAAMHEISVAHRESVAAISEGNFADIFVRGIEDYESLSPPDALRVVGFVYRLFKVWEEAYFQFKAGRLEPRIWEPMTRQFAAYYSMAPFKKTWELRSEFVDSEFRAFVNSLEKVEIKMAYHQRDQTV